MYLCCLFSHAYCHFCVAVSFVCGSNRQFLWVEFIFYPRLCVCFVLKLFFPPTFIIHKYLVHLKVYFSLMFLLLKVNPSAPPTGFGNQNFHLGLLAGCLQHVAAIKENGDIRLQNIRLGSVRNRQSQI